MKRSLLCSVLLLTILASGLSLRAQAAPDTPPKSILISCVGDCTLGNDVKQESAACFNRVYEAQGPEHFFKYVKDIFALDDLTVINLEGVLTEKGSPASKTWRFRGRPEYITMLQNASVDVCSFANNHCHDYGDISYEDTRVNLDLYGMPYSSEDNVCIVERKGVKIGIASIQSAFRHGDTAQTAEYRDTEYLKALILMKLNELKLYGAQLILLNCHWGIEGTRTASAQQKELGHFAIDNGADLVIGHHPHVLQPVECYKGKYILYSLGNFCFGGNKNPKDKQTMIWQQVFSVGPDGNTTLLAHIVPCRLSSVTNLNDYCPTPLIEGAEREKLLSMLNGICPAHGTAFDAQGNLVSLDQTLPVPAITTSP